MYRENDFFYLCYLKKHFSKDFVLSIVSFKASPKRQEAHFVNDGPYKSKIDDKAGSVLGAG